MNQRSVSNAAIPAGLRLPLAGLAITILLGVVFGDDGLIFVTDRHDLVRWAVWWAGWGAAVIFFAVFMMGGGVPISGDRDA